MKIIKIILKIIAISLGGYDEVPETTGQNMAEFARDGLVNVVGGCCGTTPDHIRFVEEGQQGDHVLVHGQAQDIAEFDHDDLINVATNDDQ